MDAKSGNSVRTVGRKRTVSLNLKVDSFASAIGGSGRRSSTGNAPLLMLTPLNETFEHKIISLPIFPETLRIGRQTNTKTVPALDNGYFDSKVLSRQHAELWGDRSGRVWIRDVKSSNGTFVNGVRLSGENRESEPKELVTQDVLELGIDIVAEDSKTVLHQKVAARVEYAGFPMASIGSGGSNGLSVTLADLDPLTHAPAPLLPSITAKSLATYEMLAKRLSRDIRLAKTTSSSLRHSADFLASTGATREVSSEPTPGYSPDGISSLKSELESTRAELRTKEDEIMQLRGQLSLQLQIASEVEQKIGRPNDELRLQLLATQEELQTWRTRAEEAERLQKHKSRTTLIRQPSPFVGAFGVVLLGVGLMTTLNGWPRTEK